MTKKLEGKTAVITGGTEGIGLATGKLFVKEIADPLRIIVVERNYPFCGKPPWIQIGGYHVHVDLLGVSKIQSFAYVARDRATPLSSL